MMFCDLNDSAAVGDELLRRHVPFGVIGLPTNDFKVSNRFCCDVINRRQHGEAPLVFSALGLRVVVVVVRAKQLWIELGPVEWVRAVAAVKCLINGFYRLLDGVLTTTPLVALSDCHSLPLDQFAVLAIANPDPGRSTPTHANTNQSLPCR